jgi:hypothetical protein
MASHTTASDQQLDPCDGLLWHGCRSSAAGSATQCATTRTWGTPCHQQVRQALALGATLSVVQVNQCI